MKNQVSVLWVVVGMTCFHAPSWTTTRIGRHLYMLGRPHVVEEDGEEWTEVVFGIEMDELAMIVHGQ